MRVNFKDLTGMVFGMVTVIKRVENDYRGCANWLLQCECGKQSVARSSSLNGGNTTSCGCQRTERSRKACITHGATIGKNKPSEYSTWEQIKDRCTNPNTPSYVNYGGRGITVCERWKNSYTDFVNDMGTKPHPDYQIDRINNNGNYEPSNCRWTTRSVNCKNRRKRRTI